jgi:hypothetical protein
MNIFPQQKLSSIEKQKRDEVSGKNWGENSVDYLCDDSQSEGYRDKILSSFRFVDGGELNNSDYEYVLNPLNTTVDRYKKFGAKLRNLDIITPVKNLYVGEFSKRFKNVTVIDSNPDDDNRYKEGLNELLSRHYEQKTVNELNAIGLQTGKPTVTQEEVASIVDKYNTNFDSNRVISGQDILEYIVFDQDLDEKYQQAYSDWVIAGVTATYKGIFNNDIDVEVVPAFQLNFPMSLRSPFLEDRAWITRKQLMPVNNILDRWHTKLTPTQVDWLANKTNDDIVSSGTHVQLPTQWISSDQDFKESRLDNHNGVEVYHAQWKSFNKVGILTHYDEIGQIQETEVDDTYKLDESIGDISIEWDWQSEVWEGWRLGSYEDYIYIDIRPLPYNRMELNNKSAQKLSYNGRANVNINNEPINITTVGRPYQIIYNILAYQREKTINKNKDKVLMMPQGLIPKGVNGWDEEKHMYYMDAASYMVYDEAQPTAGLAISGIKVLDMSLGTYINDLTTLMKEIKNEWWESVGMNRQRFGDTLASDGKGTTEQAIFRSSVISEELNRKFEKFQEKDYAGILDISKLAFIDGKKAKYVNSDGREAFLDMNVDSALFHLESDFNIHVISSSDETEKIEMAKQFGFGLGQNADGPSMLELIGSNNFEKTKVIINKLDARNKEREAELQKQAEASAKELAEIAERTQQSKNDIEVYKADKDYDKAYDVKMLDINNQPDKEKEDTSDDYKKDIDYKDLNLKNKKHIQDVKEGNQKIAESKAKVKQLNKPQTVN